MKLWDENASYEFTVEQDDAVLTSSNTVSESNDGGFVVEFHLRKYDAAPYVDPSEETRRVERVGVDGREASEVLTQMGIRGRVKVDMEDHLRFQLQRLRRLGRGRGRGGVRVGVEVREGAVGRRRAAATEERERERERRGERVEWVPARRSAVEGLKREKVTEDEERECSICLKEVVKGVTLILLPCQHQFHDICILQWLERAHACPFCRYQLPCQQ